MSRETGDEAAGATAAKESVGTLKEVFAGVEAASACWIATAGRIVASIGVAVVARLGVNFVWRTSEEESARAASGNGMIPAQDPCGSWSSTRRPAGMIASGATLLRRQNFSTVIRLRLAILAAELVTRTEMPLRSREAAPLRSSLDGITGVGRGVVATAGGRSFNG